VKALLCRAYLAVLITFLAILPASAAPALWRISDGDSQIWLFGSIHAFSNRVNWRTPIFDKALRAADLVYFETPLSASESQFATAMMKLGVNRNGKRLSDYLTISERAKLDAAVLGLKLNRNTVEVMRPWMAASTLSEARGGDSTGVRMTPGVELSVDREIPDRKKRGFETLEAHLRVISDMPEKAQVSLLMDAISGNRAPVTDDRAMDKAWGQGNVDALYSILVSAVGSPGHEAFNRVLTDRNKSWAGQITQLLATNKNVMVIVGAGHFAGPTGLPALLAKRGIKVERIQ
jgi:uncharacterized protein YbaP (TraB family)